MGDNTLIALYSPKKLMIIQDNLRYETFFLEKFMQILFG